MASITKRSFSGGELTKSLYPRCDTTKHAFGVRIMRNGYVMKHGGQINRPGGMYISEVGDSARNSRLFELTHSTGTKYLLEFGHGFVRGYADGVLKRNAAQNISGITNASPAVVTYSGADTYTAGDQVRIEGINGALGSFLNGRDFKLGTINTGANTAQLLYKDGTNVDTTALAAYTSGGTMASAMMLGTLYTEALLPYLQFKEITYEDNYALFTTPAIRKAVMVTCPGLAASLYYFHEVTGNLSGAAYTLSDSTARPSSVTNSSPGGGGDIYKVTALFENGMESLPSTFTSSNITATAGAPITVSWSNANCDKATSFNVFKHRNGVYGYIGTASGTSFADKGYDADFSFQPPAARNVFSGTDHPKVVGSVGQRVMLANVPSAVSRIYGSRVGNPYHFLVHTPLEDDDSLMFELIDGDIRHILDLGRPVILSSKAEYSIGNPGEPLTAGGSIVPGEYSSWGSSYVPPVKIGNNAIFVQANGSVVRDLGFDYSVDGYTGNDLTNFADHLFKGKQITRLAYQKMPHSLVWAVRDDGWMNCLTYVREQQILAWSRHDALNGTYLEAYATAEGTRDNLYTIVKRTINGKTVRYIERSANRDFAKIEDAVFMDSAVTTDGRNTNTALTMTISGGTNWDENETLTLTASAGYFVVGDVGKVIHLNGSNGTKIRFTLGAYTSGTIMTGSVDKTVPVSMRSAAISDWGKAVTEVTGLWHLEGQQVSIFADGHVIASPYNSKYDKITVASGKVTLPRPFVVIHVGLPYFSDIHFLDIDSSNGETLADKAMIAQAALLHIESTRGLFIGPKPPTDDATDPLENMREVKGLFSGATYDRPITLEVEKVSVSIPGEWNSSGSIFIRQVDPLPMSILACTIQGIFPGG